MTTSQRHMLDRLEYQERSIWTDVAERFAPLVVFVLALFVSWNVLQAWHEGKAKAACQDIAIHYGVGVGSLPGHSMLPPGVGVKWVSGSCVRTDNLTVVTGNERE